MKASDRLQSTKQARTQQPTIDRRAVKASSGRQREQEDSGWQSAAKASSGWWQERQPSHAIDDNKGEGYGDDDKEEERLNNGEGWMDESAEKESNNNQPLGHQVKQSGSSSCCQPVEALLLHL